MRHLFARGFLVLALGWAGPLFAQQTKAENTSGGAQGTIVSQVLTIDSERLFQDSAFGRRVAAQAEAKVTELAAENRTIEAELEAEEQALTQKRTTLSPAEFRSLADAFDRKVMETRSIQAGKARLIEETLDRERSVLLTAAAPVLEQIMRAAGAAVILERRSVFVSISAIEVTQEAIQALDNSLGDGTK